MKFFLLFLVIVVFVVIFLIRCYSSPYYISMIVGKPGVGKTTLLVKRSLRLRRAGWSVYSNERLPGCYYVPLEDVPRISYRPHSVLLIDEAGIDFNSRGYKDFSKKLIRFFKLHRHLQLSIELYSQSWDVDATIRRLCQRFSLLKRIGPLCVEKHLSVRQEIVEATGLSESKVVDNLVRVPFFAGGLSLHWLPRYYRFFDSYALDRLDIDGSIVVSEVPFPAGVKDPVRPAWQRGGKLKKMFKK